MPIKLSEREIEAATLVTRGLKDEEIAQRMGISCGTVRQHTNRIYRKLGLDSYGNARVRLAIWFLSHGPKSSSAKQGNPADRPGV